MKMTSVEAIKDEELFYNEGKADHMNVIQLEGKARKQDQTYVVQANPAG